MQGKVGKAQSRHKKKTQGVGKGREGERKKEKKRYALGRGLRKPAGY
jgi:hypothetical protein